MNMSVASYHQTARSDRAGFWCGKLNRREPKQPPSGCEAESLTADRRYISDAAYSEVAAVAPSRFPSGARSSVGNVAKASSHSLGVLTRSLAGSLEITVTSTTLRQRETGVQSSAYESYSSGDRRNFRVTRAGRGGTKRHRLPRRRSFAPPLNPRSSSVDTRLQVRSLARR